MRCTSLPIGHLPDPLAGGDHPHHLGADLAEASSRIMVGDMKNRGQKIGSDVRCDLPDAALRNIEARSRTALEIFSHSAGAVRAPRPSPEPAVQDRLSFAAAPLSPMFLPTALETSK